MTIRQPEECEGEQYIEKAVVLDSSRCVVSNLERIFNRNVVGVEHLLSRGPIAPNLCACKFSIRQLQIVITRSLVHPFPILVINSSGLLMEMT
jgi:hypothetical protein